MALEAWRTLFGLSEDSTYLKLALTHPSYANERGQAEDNQRLEFLGDAVLGFCSSELLYARFPDADEGTLTRTRAQLVNGEALATFARELSLHEEVLLGRGAVAAGLQNSTNVIADAVEALIAAAYLDGGLPAARRVCERIVDFGLARQREAGARDAKSELQEKVQALAAPPPTYRVRDSGGPAHARWFEIEVVVGGVAVGCGRGRSKRLAEQLAAAEALNTASYIDVVGSRETHDTEEPGSALEGAESGGVES
jgi:ribonuclease-3